jgi:hypothetical protein
MIVWPAPHFVRNYPSLHDRWHVEKLWIDALSRRNLCYDEIVQQSGGVCDSKHNLQSPRLVSAEKELLQSRRAESDYLSRCLQEYNLSTKVPH